MSETNFDVLTADRDAFFANWKATRAELDTVLQNLSDADLEEPGMTGVWSGRETLVHIARWDETTTEMIVRRWKNILPGVNEYSDYEGQNMEWAALDADITLEASRQRYHASHEAIMRTMAHIPFENWDEYIRGWVGEASLYHYLHHAETTKRWLAARGGEPT